MMLWQIDLPLHCVYTHRILVGHRTLNIPEKESVVLTALLLQKAVEDMCAEIRTNRIPT